MTASTTAGQAAAGAGSQQQFSRHTPCAVIKRGGSSQEDGSRGMPARDGTRSMPATLAVDLAHDDVERADDGGDVGDQAAAAELVGDGEVAEAGAASAGPPGDRVAVADDVEAHLAAGSFGLQVG